MRTKVTGYLTQKRGFYYVVLNMPSDIKGKRIRKTLSTGLSTARNMTKAKEVMREMIREGETVSFYRNGLRRVPLPHTPSPAG
mgnify:CR=1 FL=1